MKILITGGTGFVGRNIIKNLQSKKYKIFLIQRKKKYKKKIDNSINCDLKNRSKLINIMNTINPNIVIHLAWYGIPNFNKANCEKNFKISKNLIDATLQNQNCEKLIITGTCKEYEGYYGACKEGMRLNPKSKFSKTKFKIFEYMKKKIKNNRKIDWYWFRVFYVYGFFQRSDSLIPYLLKNIKNKKKVILNNQNHSNDYINIKFLSKAFKNIINNKIKKGIYNFGSGTIKSNFDIRNICLKIYKRKQFKNNNEDKSKKYIFASMEKFKKNFGWVPKENIYREIKKLKNFT